MRICCATAIGALAMGLVFESVSPAAGQDPPRVEIGATLSGIPAAEMLGLGVRVTAAGERQFAFEAGLDWTDARRERHFADQITWFYFLQAKQTLAQNAPPRLFLTYGAAGWLERTTTGRRGEFRSVFIPPIIGLAGVGGQYVVAKYAAVRFDAQLIICPYGEEAFVTPRVSGGITVPIGRYRR